MTRWNNERCLVGARAFVLRPEGAALDNALRARGDPLWQWWPLTSSFILLLGNASATAKGACPASRSITFLPSGSSSASLAAATDPAAPAPTTMTSAVSVAVLKHSAPRPTRRRNMIRPRRPRSTPAQQSHPVSRPAVRPAHAPRAPDTRIPRGPADKVSRARDKGCNIWAFDVISSDPLDLDSRTPRPVWVGTRLAPAGRRLAQSRLAGHCWHPGRPAHAS